MHAAETANRETIASCEALAAKIERMRAARASDPRPANVVAHPAHIRGRSDHECDENGPPVEVAMEVPTCSVCGVPQVFPRPEA